MDAPKQDYLNTKMTRQGLPGIYLNIKMTRQGLPGIYQAL